MEESVDTIPPDEPPPLPGTEPESEVRYDFEADAPAHLPPEMYEEWRSNMLGERARHQTNHSRWRLLTLTYGAGGMLIAYLISGLFRVGPDWFRPALAISCGIAIWDVVARGRDQLQGAAAYGGTAFVFIAFGIVNSLIHPVAITLTPLYAAVGAIMAVAARSRRWTDFDSF